MIVPQQATLEPRGLGAKRISEAPDMRKRVTSAIILCGYPPGCALAALLLQHAPGQEQGPYERFPQIFIPDNAPLDVADDAAEIGLELA